jgi:hypothetical protein
VFASTAPNAFCLVDYDSIWRRFFFVRGNQVNRLHGAFADASGASVAIDVAHAKIFLPDGVAHVNMDAHFILEFFKRAGGAYFTALGAGDATITITEIEFGLTEILERS